MFKTSSIKAGVAGCLTGLALLLSACQSAPPLVADSVVVYMTQDGGILWNKKRIGIEELKSLATTLAHDAPDASVQVGADPSVSYGDVMEALAILQRSGLAATGLASGT